MNRRTFLRRSTALSSLVAVAGCVAPDGGTDGRNERDGETESGGNITGTAPIPTLEDPPDAVYLPGHRTAMEVLEPIDAGDYRLTPMLSYPHPFWLVTGTDREFVEPTAGRGVHVMLVVWDPETGIVLPGTVAPHATITGPDGWTETRSLWPMVSQGMGAHFGDNVAFPEDGRYTMRVDLPPLSTRRTGAFAGRFDDAASATVEFTYDRAFREAVVGGIELLERDRWGTRGALEPMGRGGDGTESSRPTVPYSSLPPARAYPGTHLLAADESRHGLPTSDDATAVVTLLERGSRLANDDAGYLLVSPRTPYNRVPLSNLSLRVVVDRDGSTVVDRTLRGTLDGELGFHYGGSVPPLHVGDSVTVVVDSPPQVARHRGYETAFIEMEPLECVVPAQ